MPGIGDSWGTREELLHPRDKNGRFRSKWKMATSVVDAITGFLSKFNPRTFGSDGQAAQYTFNLANKRPKVDLRRFSADFSQTNKALQAGQMDPSTKKYVDMMDRSALELPDDLIMSRVTGPENFGLTAETMHLDEGGIEDFTGRLLSNRAYTSFNVGTPLTQAAGPGKIKLVIAAPKGTKVIIPGRSPGDREVVSDRNQEIRITKVDSDGTGGYYMLAVATDRTPGETPEPLNLTPGGDQANIAQREANVTNLAQAQSRRYGDTGDVGGTMEGVAERQALAQQAQAPAPPGTPPPRTEPIVSPAVGGPAVPQAPGAAAPGAAPGAPDSGPRLVNIRQVVKDANIPSPSRGKRRSEWNDAYLGLASGKKDPADVLRELQRDIDVNKRVLSDNRAAGDDSDREFESDIKAQEQLRDLIEKEYGFQDADEAMRREIEEETAAEFEGEAPRRAEESAAPAAPVIPPAPAPAKKAAPAVKRTAAGLPKQEGLTPVRKRTPTKAAGTAAEPSSKPPTLAETRRLAAIDVVKKAQFPKEGAGGHNNIVKNLESGTWTVPKSRQEALKSAKYWRQQATSAEGFGRATPEKRQEVKDRLNKIADQYETLAKDLTDTQAIKKATPAKKAAPTKPDAGPKTVDTMTKVELLEEAKRQGVDVRQSWTKDRIKAAIGEGPKERKPTPDERVATLLLEKMPADIRKEVLADMPAADRKEVLDAEARVKAATPEVTPEERVKTLFNGKRPTNTQLLSFARERGIQVDPKDSRGELILSILGQTELRRGQARELVPPAPAPVAKAAKVAVPGAAPGTAAGKITVSRLTKGSRILVARDSKGEWSHATKKTGATALTVDEVKAVDASRRGFSQRAVSRRQIVGHDDNGNQITVSSLAPAQTVMAAPDLKASLADQIQGKTPDEMARILGGSDVTTKDLKQIAQDLNLDTTRVSPRGSVRQPVKKSEWITAIIEGKKRPTVTGPSLEDAARDRQSSIDEARKRAVIGGELDQLITDGASTSALLSRLDAESSNSGLRDDPDFVRIRAAAEAGNLPEARRLTDAWLKKNGVTQVTKAGDEGSYDPGQHQTIGGGVTRGDPVRVIRPGFSLKRNGEDIQLSKAIVEKVDVAAETRVPQGSVPGLRTQTPVDNKPRKREFTEAWKAADVKIPDGLARRSTNEVIDDIAKGNLTPEEGIRRLESDISFNKEDLAEKDAIFRNPMPPAERRDLRLKIERLEEAISGQEESSKFLRLYFADEKPSVAEVKESIKAEDPKTFGDMLKNAKPEEMKEAAKLSGLDLKDPKGDTAEEMFDDLIKQIVTKEPERRQSKKKATRDFDALAEQISRTTGANRKDQIREIVKDLGAGDLNKLAAKFPEGGVESRSGVLKIPAGKTIPERRDWLVDRLGENRTQSQRVTPEELEIEREFEELSKQPAKVPTDPGKMDARLIAEGLGVDDETLNDVQRALDGEAIPGHSKNMTPAAIGRFLDTRAQGIKTHATIQYGEWAEGLGEGLTKERAELNVQDRETKARLFAKADAISALADRLKKTKRPAKKATPAKAAPETKAALKDVDDLKARIINNALEELRNAKTRDAGENALEGLTADEIRRLTQQAGLPPQRTKALNRGALIDRFVQSKINSEVLRNSNPLGGPAPDTPTGSAKEQADKLRRHAQVTRQLAGMRIANNPKGSAHHTRGLADEKEADRLENEADRLDPPEHLRNLPIKKATPSKVAGTSPVVTQETLRDLPTREAGYDAVKGMNKKQLVELARSMSVPNAASLNMNDLRREIVEGTTGRRLDSIATRGFTGPRPGLGDVQGRPDLPSPTSSGATGTSPATPVRSRSGSRDTPDGRLPVRERPRADEEAFLPNNGNDQGFVHMDSELGGLWWDLYHDDREPNSFVNEIAKIGEDVGKGSLPLSQALTRLQALKGRATDSAVADRIQRAIDGMDTPPVELPDLPDSVPAAVRRALQALADIPTARKSNIRGQSQKESALDSKIDIVRRIDSGEIGRLGDAEQQLRKRNFHESIDGSVEMWRIFDSLANPQIVTGYKQDPSGKMEPITEPNPAYQEIRQWILEPRKKRS